MSIFRYKYNNEDLGQTPLENLFINHYMPGAPGDYVKIYLLGLKYSLSYIQNRLSNEIIAKTLNIHGEEVTNAWKYWEEQGIIKLYPGKPESSDSDLIVEFLSIKEIMLNIKGTPISAPVEKYGTDRIIRSENDPHIKAMFKNTEKIKGQPLSSTEMFMFLDCVDEYHMSPEVVVKILEYCYEKDIRQPNYFKQTAKGWYEDGITTIDKANEYLERHKEKWKKFNLVAKFFRMQSPINDFQEKLLYKWFYEYKYEDEIVLKACEQIGKRMNPDFGQIDRIIAAWFEKNLRTLSDIEAYILKTPNKESKKAKESDKPGFNNFANRTYDTKHLKEQLLKKSRGELSE